MPYLWDTGRGNTVSQIYKNRLLYGESEKKGPETICRAFQIPGPKDFADFLSQCEF